MKAVKKVDDRPSVLCPNCNGVFLEDVKHNGYPEPHYCNMRMANTNKFLIARIELEMMVTEREMMVAENKQREILGQSMAYQDDSFFELSDRMNELLQRMQQ